MGEKPGEDKAPERVNEEPDPPFISSTGSTVYPPLPGAKIIEETAFIRIWETPAGGRIHEHKFPKNETERVQMAAMLHVETDPERAADGIKSVIMGLSYRINKERVWDPRLDEALRNVAASHPLEAARVRVVYDLLDQDVRFDELLDYCVETLKRDPSVSLRTALAKVLGEGQKKASPLTFLKGAELEEWKRKRSRQVRETLEQMRQTDPDSEVRAMAERALADLDTR